MRDQVQPTRPIELLLVRVGEAARILSWSRSTIYQMLDRGELPSVRRGRAAAFRWRRSGRGSNT